MKDWIDENILKSWTEAQKRLWDSLSTALPAFRPPEGMDLWQETYQKNLTAWESAVKQSLAVQAAWIKQWADRVANEQATPENMAEWTHQVEEVMQRWIDTQTQLWDDWFEMLKTGGNVARQRSLQPTPGLPLTAKAPREESTSKAGSAPPAPEPKAQASSPAKPAKSTAAKASEGPAKAGASAAKPSTTARRSSKKKEKKEE